MNPSSNAASHWRSVSLLPAVLAWGCAAPLVPTAAVVRVEPTAATSAAGPQPLEEPPAQKLACRFKGENWYQFAVSPRVELRFDRLAPPYASVWGAKTTTLELPVGTAEKGARLEVDINGVHLTGNVVAEQITLHPQRRFVLHHALVPTRTARLRWLEGKPGKVRFGLELGKELRLVGAPAEAELPCADLGLAWGEYEARAEIGKALPDSPMVLPSHRVIDFAKEPGGAPVVQLELSNNDGDQVEVTELQANQARIVWSSSAVLLFGWVRRDLLLKPNDSFGYGGLGMIGNGPGGGGWHRVTRCTHDLPLWAQSPGHRQRVGYIAAGTPFLRGQEGPRGVQVQFPKATLSPMNGASFLVRARELQDCTTAGSD